MSLSRLVFISKKKNTKQNNNHQQQESQVVDDTQRLIFLRLLLQGEEKAQRLLFTLPQWAAPIFSALEG